MRFIYFKNFWAFKQKSHKWGWAHIHLVKIRFGWKLWLVSAFLCQSHFVGCAGWSMNVTILRRKNQSGKLPVNAGHVLCHHTNKVIMAWEGAAGQPLRHSWNSKKRSQELKCYTHASHTSPLSQYNSLTLVSLAFFKLLLALIFSSSICSLSCGLCSFTSFPFWPFLLNSSHTSFPPLVVSERLGLHLNIIIYMMLVLTGAWHHFTVVQSWWWYETICSRLIKIATS